MTLMIDVSDITGIVSTRMEQHKKFKKRIYVKITSHEQVHAEKVTLL